MNYTSTEIGKILSPSGINSLKKYHLEEISIDSRTINNPAQTLFFALPGELNDGHNFIDIAHDLGVRNFVVKQAAIYQQYKDSNFYVVSDVLESLQKLATYHRGSFQNLKRVGITGSNGKTIIKEWLYQMLYDVFHIIKSPKSYNSQIGMALSLLGIEKDHDLGIFEAGISRKSEMTNHLQMLDPEIGLVTNLGSAHDEGFSSRQEKLNEKMILFKHSKLIIYKKDDRFIDDFIESQYSNKDKFTWGDSNSSDIQIVEDKLRGTGRFLKLNYKGESIDIELRFSDKASFENSMHCIAVMASLGLSLNDIKHRMHRVSGLHMRMEMTTGINQSILINDAYSADLDSLQVALDFMKQHAGNRKKIAILSAFDQSGKDELYVFKKIVEQLSASGVSELIYISKNRFDIRNEKIGITFYDSKEALLDSIKDLDVSQKVILVKGARRFELEDVSDRLSEKGHSATMMINLNALDHNLRIYKNYLHANTGIIAVVKASAYGTGSAEIARLLERNGVNYLAVAFADEGIALRRDGIGTKIMVFNPDLTSLPDIIRYQLEPEVYAFEQLNQIINYSNQNEVEINIHLKLDTGMHRLGFQESDMVGLCSLLTSGQQVIVSSVFSHLASSEDASEDGYSEKQFDGFDKMYAQVTEGMMKKPKRHILNSGGISRFPDRQYDFVRLGIGMYGIDNNPDIKSSLRKVHKLNASLIQIKKMKKGDGIGYNRKTILDSDRLIGIVNIGYADGVMRNLGNGNYSFIIQGAEAKILGNVCMDLTIVDLSNIPDAKVGDNAVVFDDYHSIEMLASSAGTIPYEILSRISTRVSRKFIYE